ncbi:MAG: NnrU family protein [Methylobacterium sp.]|nr:NnrU family protein [Methylobacterium sp.]
MNGLVAGLVIFLGGHLVSRFTGLRQSLMNRFGPNLYRSLYSLVALMGFALIIHGFGVYRAAGYIPVWEPPRFLAHLSVLLVWPAFILLAATYLPGLIKAKAKHPMLAAVKLWATAHLLANGDLGSILLFGSFLGWAVYARIALKRSGAPTMPAPSGFTRNDVIAVVIGTLVTLAFMFGLHRTLIGVGIFGV